jgi:chemotaxis protein MotA
MNTETKSFETLSGVITESNEATKIDAGTLLGVLAGVCLIVIAIFRGGDPGVFMNLNSVFIVLGATIATTFIAFSSKKVLGLLPVIVNSFKADIYQPADFIEDIMALSVKYRTGGLKQLESLEEYLFRQSIFENWHHFSDGWIHRP